MVFVDLGGLPKQAVLRRRDRTQARVDARNEQDSKQRKESVEKRLMNDKPCADCLNVRCFKIMEETQVF